MRVFFVACYLYLGVAYAVTGFGVLFDDWQVPPWKIAFACLFVVLFCVSGILGEGE